MHFGIWLSCLLRTVLSLQIPADGLEHPFQESFLESPSLVDKGQLILCLCLLWVAGVTPSLAATLTICWSSFTFSSLFPVGVCGIAVLCRTYHARKILHYSTAPERCVSSEAWRHFHCIFKMPKALSLTDWIVAWARVYHSFAWVEGCMMEEMRNHECRRYHLSSV